MSFSPEIHDRQYTALGWKGKAFFFWNGAQPASVTMPAKMSTRPAIKFSILLTLHIQHKKPCSPYSAILPNVAANRFFLACRQQVYWNFMHFLHYMRPLLLLWFRQKVSFSIHSASFALDSCLGFALHLAWFHIFFVAC